MLESLEGNRIPTIKMSTANSPRSVASSAVECNSEANTRSSLIIEKETITNKREENDPDNIKYEHQNRNGDICKLDRNNSDKTKQLEQCTLTDDQRLLLAKQVTKTITLGTQSSQACTLIWKRM